MNLEKKHIFILALPRFDDELESTNYFVAKELAKNNYVYYIDNPYTINDYLKFRNSPKFQTRKPYLLFNSAGTLETTIPNLKIIITPIVPSINFLPESLFYRICLKISEYRIRRSIKKVLQKNNIKKFIYINSANFHYPGVSSGLSPELRVYHCMDPLIVAFDIKHGITSEEQLVNKSDLIICTSKQLYTEKKQLNAKTYFIPNAVDLSHCSKALDINLPVHDLIKNIKSPVIGYFGNIERRMDYELLKEVIEQNPDKSFVFCGPVSKEFVPEWFFAKPNIYLTGPMPYKDMPSLIKGFDVALIPFKKDGVSRSIFPLKLFEYLGAGKPVVATMFNSDLKDFTQETVAFCEDASSFSKAINEALEKNGSSIIQARINVAQNNTWEKRTFEISELIASNIESAKYN